METELVDTGNFKAVKMPNDWRFSTVGQSLLIRNNLRFPISEEEREKIQGDYPYYGPTKVQGYVDHYRVEGKYALIGEDGDHFLKFKELQMTLLVEGKFNVNNHAHIIEGTDQCTTEWFYYFFAHRDLFSHLTRQGVGRYKLTKDALQRLPIQLPPISQQRKIVAILSTWDEAIQTAIQLLKAKQERKRGLMQQLLTKQKRLLGFSGDWREVKLKEICSRLTRRNGEGNTNVLTISAQLGLISQRDFFNKSVASEEVKNYFLLKRGEFAYNKSYSAGYPYGAIKRLEYYEKGILSPLYICLSVAKGDSDFFAHLFEFGALNHGIYRIAQEGARNHGLLNISAEDFFQMPIQIPERDEQQAIATVLNVAEEEIQLAKAEVKALKQQKRGLMQQLLTGQRLVTVDEQEHQYGLLQSTPL